MIFLSLQSSSWLKRYLVGFNFGWNFALGLQFNPYSPIAGEDAEKFAKFVELHTLLKDAPVLAEADVADYLVDLKAARDLLQEVYGFDAENVEGW